MWIWPILLFVPLYIMTEVFTKKYVDVEEKYSALKLLINICIISTIISMLVYLLGLNESGIGPIETLIDHPEIFVLVFLYPASLFFAYLAYKRIELSKVAAITYGNSVIVFVIQEFYYMIQQDYEMLTQTLTLPKILVMCFVLAGFMILTCLCFVKDDEKPEEKINLSAAFGILLGFISMVLSGFENLLDNHISSSHAIETFDFIGTYYFMGVVALPILWLIATALEKKPYNPFNIKKTKYALIATLLETVASAIYLIGAGINEKYMKIGITLVPLLIIFVARKNFLERLKLEEYIGIIFLIISIGVFAICEAFGI